jgi:DNA gyrase/topoisomerase IV subunit B
MNTLGLNPTQKAIRGNLRYGKVYLASDMDADGANINSLLINFFYTYWPELFKDESNPFIYIFMTPFVIAEKGKQRKYWYSHNYHEFKSDDWKGWGITRAKGLGTLTKEDWQYSIHNPVLVPVIDDGKMLESLSLIFDGTKANERKEWIGI